MNRRPEFCVAFGPPTPMKAPTLAMFGSAWKIAATRSWRSIIAVNEMSSAASVVTWICPVSSSGKKPFGITTNSTALATKLASATSHTVLRCASAQSSVCV